jgi:hypothetical protein
MPMVKRSVTLTEALGEVDFEETLNLSPGIGNLETQCPAKSPVLGIQVETFSGLSFVDRLVIIIFWADRPVHCIDLKHPDTLSTAGVPSMQAWKSSSLYSAAISLSIVTTGPK